MSAKILHIYPNAEECDHEALLLSSLREMDAEHVAADTARNEIRSGYAAAVERRVSRWSATLDGVRLGLRLGAAPAALVFVVGYFSPVWREFGAVAALLLFLALTLLTWLLKCFLGLAWRAL